MDIRCFEVGYSKIILLLSSLEVVNLTQQQKNTLVSLLKYIFSHIKYAAPKI
ncbi:hypothetical protein EMIT091MI3_110115 [Kosakonia quasisacchari]